jgi:hypothetical protein
MHEVSAEAHELQVMTTSAVERQHGEEAHRSGAQCVEPGPVPGDCASVPEARVTIEIMLLHNYIGPTWKAKLNSRSTRPG